MSNSGFKFKLKLNTAPSLPSQPGQSAGAQQGGASRREASGAPALQNDEVSGGHHAPRDDLPASGAAGAAVPEKKTVFKIKVKQPGAAQPSVPKITAPLASKRPAEDQHPQAPKRIKLITGPKKAPVVPGSAGGPPPAASQGLKPKIRLKTSAAPLPPKQPRLPGDAPSPAPPSGFAALLGQESQPVRADAARQPATAHPVVRLTVHGGSGAKKQRGAKKAAARQGAPGGGPPRQKGAAWRSRQQRIQQQQSQQLQLQQSGPVEEPAVPAGPALPRVPITRHAVATSSMAASEGAAPSGSKGLEEVGMVLGDDDDDEVDDVAFTDAPEAMPPSQGPGEGDAAPALPIMPPLTEDGPLAKKEDLERVVRLIQKKDHHGIFKEPVTEEVAPGYFKVIQEPMDFTTMRGKLERGEYATYEDLQKDLRLMFLNAMKYNPSSSPFYSHARTMLFSAEKLVEQARQGVLSQRQAAGEARKQNAQLRAQERAQRDALRAAARAEQKAAQEAKILRKAGVGVLHEESLDESVRNSYRRPLREAGQLCWRGLGAGASAEGAAFCSGRHMLCPATPAVPPGSYKASLTRFAAGLTGKARELALARAAAATPQADAAAADSMLKKQLAKQPSSAELTTTVAVAPFPGAGLSAGLSLSSSTVRSVAPPVSVAATSMAAGHAVLTQGVFNPMLLQQFPLQRSQQGVVQGLPHALSQQQLAAMAATFKQQQQQLVTAAGSVAQQQQQQQHLSAMLTPAQHQALLLQQQQALLAHQRLQMQQQGQRPDVPGTQQPPACAAPMQGVPTLNSGTGSYLPAAASLQKGPPTHQS